MTELQQYLKKNGLQKLQDEFHVAAKRHGEYNNLVCLKYDMIDSPLGHKVVQQSRGCILDEKRGWEYVSRPFDKFFNHGEGHASTIDWSSARVQEKLDGSLVQMYHYRGSWHFGTSGTPDASGNVHATNRAFRDLVRKVWYERRYQAPPDTSYTYLFELCSKENRVVVSHPVDRLVLIGVRRTWSGLEAPVSWFKKTTNWEVVQEYPLQTTEDIVATFDTMDPLKMEGYVIVDHNFNRIKVKHPGYVAIHHMKDGFGPKRMLEVIRSGETSEVLNAFPEWKPEFEAIQEKYRALVTHLEAEYARLKDIPDQKAFALEAVKTRHPGTLFMLRKGRFGSVRESLANITLDNLQELVK